MKCFQIWLVLGLCFHLSDNVKVSDILNAEYLPSTLLLEEAALDSANDDLDLFNTTSYGDIKDAFSTMQYHRSMMNEYLCRSYVADEIIAELGSKGIARLGLPAKKHRNHRPHDTLLKDQGSSSYKDWLSRSTLLDDVYRHYDQTGAGDGDGSDEMESGEVTGYAIQSSGSKNMPTTSYGPPVFGPEYGGGGGGGGHVGGDMHYPGGFQGGTGHGTVGGFGGGHPEPPLHGGSAIGPDYGIHGGDDRGDEHYYYPEEPSQGKGLALKDLFDLALTALAFLAFGMFIMNLIMNCMLGNQGTTIVMQTTTATTAEATTAAATRLRSSRLFMPDEQLNEMAYRVLSSVDHLMELHQARTTHARSCFQYSLCKNNKYSRTLNGKDRIWLPVWSFGLSWLVGRIGEDRLSNLQASVLGLGNADCKKAYPSCARKSKSRR